MLQLYVVVLVAITEWIQMLNKILRAVETQESL